MGRVDGVHRDRHRHLQGATVKSLDRRGDEGKSREALTNDNGIPDRLVLFLVFGFLLFMLAPTRADPDLWGHVLFGGDVLTEGLTRADPYAYTSQEWINHEWLAEVLFYGAWWLGGGPGLVLLKTLAALGLVALFHCHLVRTGHTTLSSGVLLVLAAVPLVVSFGTIRPHVFTNLLFAAVLILLDRRDRGARRGIWFLPLLFAIWANLHGGFLAGLAVLILWCLVESVSRALQGVPPSSSLILVTFLSSLATLLNPYGVDLWSFLASTAFSDRPEISEWAPIAIGSIEGLAYALVLTVSVIAVVRRPRSMSIPGIFTFAGMAWAPLMAIRHLPLFIATVLVLAARPIRETWLDRWSQRTTASWKASPSLVKTTRLVVAILAVILSIGALPAFRGVRLPEDYYPVRAVSALRQTAVEGNLAVHFDWGEYSLWHLHPRIRVSIDGRRETVYDREVYLDNLRFILGTGEWDAILEKYPTDFALVPTGGVTWNLLRSDARWSLTYSDGVATVFVRGGSRWGEPLVSTELPSAVEARWFP